MGLHLLVLPLDGLLLGYSYPLVIPVHAKAEDKCAGDVLVRSCMSRKQALAAEVST